MHEKFDQHLDHCTDIVADGTAEDFATAINQAIDDFLVDACGYIMPFALAVHIMDFGSQNHFATSDFIKLLSLKAKQEIFTALDGVFLETKDFDPNGNFIKAN